MKLLEDADLENMVSPFPDHTQLLLICIKLSNDDMGMEIEEDYVWELEEKLITLLADCDFAHYDGHEWGGGLAKIFLYSSDVDRLYKLAHKLLKNYNFTPDSKIILDYEGAENQFIIDPNKLPD